jgi:hypothetical protein
MLGRDCQSPSRTRIGLVVALLLGSWPSSSRAERVWLTYGSAPGAGCPTQEEFFAAVSARTDRLELASTPEGVTTYHVSLGSERDQDGAGDDRSFFGRLEIVSANGAVTVRNVRGDTCPHVADAIALVVALGIDPYAAATPTVPPSPGPPPSPFLEAAPAPAPLPPSPTAPPLARPQTHSSSSKSRVGLFAAFGLDMSAGVIPKVLFGPALVVEAGLFGEPHNGLAWLPDARVSGTFSHSSEPGTSPEVASFDWAAGRLDLCPARATWGRVDGGLCGRAEVGRLADQGTGVTSGRSHAYPWVALGGTARFRFRIVSRLYLELEASIAAPLVQESFYFSQPHIQIGNVAPVSGAGVLALGVRFW